MPDSTQYQEKSRTFLEYYDRELSYLRRLGTEFIAKYSQVASRLGLEASNASDPHVERLLDSFAFLAARIHKRLDDEFPEITGALLGELYPYFTRPIPSLSLVEFQVDAERGKATVGRKVARGTPVETRPANGFVCRFRTCFDTELLPLTITNACWRPASSLPQSAGAKSTAGGIEIRISCFPDVSFASLPLDRLRFYLNGPGSLVNAIYELLLARCHSIIVRDPTAGLEVPLPGAALAPVGFGAAEGLCWEANKSFAGYQILQDYFLLPEKFLFVDLTGLDQLASAGMGEEISILFLLSPFERNDWRGMLEQGIGPRTFKLGCTPIVNLFPASADPNLVRNTVYEMPVQVDSRMEIYSVDGVAGVTSSGDRRPYEPFINCQRERARGASRYWQTARRPAIQDGVPGEVVLSLIDRDLHAVETDVSTLLIKLTCSNGPLPHQWVREGQSEVFQMADHPDVQKIVCLKQPSEGCRPPAAQTSLWRLVSQLSLNHLSLVEGGDAALRCLLEIHNLSDSDDGRKIIHSIAGLKSDPHFARVSGPHGIAFVRGKRVEITVDEDQLGNGAFLFGSVIEHFLGLYTSLNSFSQLVLKSRQRGEKPIHIFPPRAGAGVVV